MNAAAPTLLASALALQAAPRPTGPYTAVVVVPTGVGARSAGTPATLLMAPRSLRGDVLARQRDERRATVRPALSSSYRGYALDEFAAGRWGLRPATSQRVGLLLGGGSTSADAPPAGGRRVPPTLGVDVGARDHRCAGGGRDQHVARRRVVGRANPGTLPAASRSCTRRAARRSRWSRASRRRGRGDARGVPCGRRRRRGGRRGGDHLPPDHARAAAAVRARARAGPLDVEEELAPRACAESRPHLPALRPRQPRPRPAGGAGRRAARQRPLARRHRRDRRPRRRVRRRRRALAPRLARARRRRRGERCAPT